MVACWRVKVCFAASWARVPDASDVAPSGGHVVAQGLSSCGPRVTYGKKTCHQRLQLGWGAGGPRPERAVRPAAWHWCTMLCAGELRQQMHSPRLACIARCGRATFTLDCAFCYPANGIR